VLRNIIVEGALLAKDLLPLETYAHQREGYRAGAVAHRQDRTVRVGPNAMVIFEDELTVRYQIQEMLHRGGISEDEGIQAEIDVYAPLIPDGSNLKATFLFEFHDEVERRTRLAQLSGVEKRVWVQIEGSSRVWAIADEDIDREGAGETAAVHFLRFELEKSMVRGLKQGSPLAIGIDHPSYSARLVLRESVRRALLNDLR
jgi:hypothetical protein